MNHKHFGRVWARLWLGLMAFAVLGGVIRPALAASPESHLVVELRFFAQPFLLTSGATTEATRLMVRVSTQFWADGRQLSPDELAALAGHISFDDQAYRGHAILLAAPPAGAVSLAKVDSFGVIDLGMAEVSGLGVQAPAADIATMDAPVWLRDQRVVRLRFQPLRYDPVTGTTSVHPQILAAIALEDARPSSMLPRPDPYWEPIYQRALSNYQEGRRWRGMAPVAPDGLAGAAPLPVDSSWRLRVTVTEPGLYEIGYDDILRLGAAIGGVDPRRLQLFAGASALPCLVRGEGDGRLDPGDAVIFYAPPPATTSKYSSASVFWLVLGAENGLRVGQRSGAGQAPILNTFQERAHHEVQRLYFSSFPATEASDHWFWLSLRPARNGPGRQTISFPLDGVATGPGQARLRIHVWGQEEGVARVGLQIADYAVGAFGVSGRSASTSEFTIPHALLHSGANELTIEVSRTVTSTNSVLLDWIEIEHMRLYEAVEGRLAFDVGWPGRWQLWLAGLDETAMVWDVTDPAQPLVMVDVRAAGEEASDRVGFVSAGAAPRRYAAATALARRRADLAWAPVLDDLRDPDTRVDYLIISPETLLPAAQRLARHRAAHGLAVKVVSAEAIYDEFNAGEVDPQAIRSFLATALRQWRPPAPAFAVILGDATFDPLGYLGPPPVQVPGVFRLVDPWLGEVADENAFAAVSGADIVPDLMYGRLPAGSLTLAETLVDKITGYDALPVGAEWQRRLLLAADNPDGAGDFTTLAEDIADLAAPSLDLRRLYLTAYPNAERLRADLLSGWSEGALVVNYIGHGQASAWAAEQILNKAEAQSLQNRGRPAVVLAMSSLSGIFTQVGASSLLEDLLLMPEGRGAVGYVASTGYGISVGNALVNEGFLQAILVDKAALLGRAAIQGKLSLYTRGYDFTEYLTRLYTLFGDPAMQLPLSPWAQRYYLPVVTR